MRSLNLSGCLLCNQDYAAVCELVRSGDFPNLTRLLLVQCRRLCAEASASDACQTTVCLLHENLRLKVVAVFDTGLLNIDKKEELFDKLSVSELCRLVWLPAEWCVSTDSEEEGEPGYWNVLRDPGDLPVADVARVVMNSHEEYYSVWGKPY